MKNIFFAVLLMFGVVAGMSQSTATLSMPDLSGYGIGDEVVVPITADAVDAGVSGFFFSVLYDPTVLTWVKSQGLHPNANATYFSENLAFDGDYRGSWLDFLALSSFAVAPGDVMLEVVFTYNGGECDITFATSKSVADGKAVKQATEMTDELFTGFILTLMDGSISAAPLANTWEGDDVIVPDDWFTAENWSAGTVPTTEDVVIPTGLTNYPFIMGGVEATCGALTIEAGAIIQFSYDGYLTAMGNTMCDGDIEIMSDNLGNSGSFIDNGTIAGAGNLMFERDIVSSSAAGDEHGWHLISSPLGTSYTNYDMYDYYVNTWNEPAHTFIQHAGSPTIPCTPAAEITLSQAMGWSVKQDLAYLCEATLPGTGSMLHFDGAITDVNTGIKGGPATYTNGGTTADGYNLVGNPYTSGIDASLIVFPAELDGSVNTWNAGTHQYDEWTSAAGSYVIAPTQGFWVMATANTNFLVDNNSRAHGGMFYKESLDNVLQLSVTGNGSYDETFVRFMEGTSDGYDLHLDGKKMFSTSMPSLYTTSGGQQLAIDAQEATEQVPMSFSSETPGTYTVEAFETSNFTNVYLQDLQSGVVTDLLAQSHEFTHTDGVQNFIIHFAPVGINEINANTVKIWASDNTIMVNVPADVTGEVVVYNMMGQEVTRTDIVSVETQVSVSDVNTNYVVKVISNSNTVTGKVYVK